VLRRVEPDESAAALVPPWESSRSEAIVPAVANAEFDGPVLPSDHPRWVRDAVALSQRAKEIVNRLRPAVVRVLCFWDHRLHAIVVHGQRIEIDSAGSYRTAA
jgi:capsular polysaccharide biosynthesis protein